MFLVAPSACNCTPQYQSVSPRTEYEFKVRGRSETEFAAAFRVLRQLYGPIDSVGDTRRTSVYFDRGRRLEQRGIRLRTNRRHDANSMVLLKATARSSGPSPDTR